MHGTSTLPPPPSLRSLRAQGPVSLFLDFDGTLVELADTPQGIAVPDLLHQGLCSLSDRLEGRLALVSGRAVSDLERHLGALKVARAGSHGSDRQHADGLSLDGPPEGISEDARRQLQEFAERSGFSLEDKPHGAALHYRARPELEKEGLDFATGLAKEYELVVKRGKCVIELVRPGADKGGAVRAFMQHEPFAGSHPVFIGDDITDEDGFRAVTEQGGTAILVGEREPTAATYGLANPQEVLAWLSL